MKKFVTIILIGLCVPLFSNIGAQDDCDFVFGDWNCNGTPFELSDPLAFVAVYRGAVPPCYFCDCGIHGEDFPVSADANGNCIPFELADLVYALCTNRIGCPPVICPDCLQRQPRN
jgi:hypothetical protein